MGTAREAVAAVAVVAVAAAVAAAAVAVAGTVLGGLVDVDEATGVAAVTAGNGMATVAVMV